MEELAVQLAETATEVAVDQEAVEDLPTLGWRLTTLIVTITREWDTLILTSEPILIQEAWMGLMESEAEMAMLRSKMGPMAPMVLTNT
jgi:hypothetical protein